MALMNNIGIKLFDGSFVPILKENEIKSKRVILTTVRDNQTKTIIELYEGASNNCINNEYLGKLVISIDRDTGKGQPAIEAHLRLDANGILYAKAWDVESGEESEIQIEHSGTKRIRPETMSDVEIDQLGSESTQIITDTKTKGKMSPLILALMIAGIALVLIGIIGIVGYKFLYEPIIQPKIEKMIAENKESKDRDGDVKDIEKTIKDKQKDKIADTSETDKQREKDKRIDERKNKDKQTDSTIGLREKEGKTHYIRWGDNLWNICKQYYEDPWYYPSLSEYNELKNSRLILAGSKIVIPSKSELTRWDFSK